MIKTPRVIFIPVKDNSSKLNAICQTVQNHFDRKNAVLITVPNNEAAEYVDQLLWRMPEESFLPHQIAVNATKELIAITTIGANINGARILFNLCPQAIPFFQEFEAIYELDDATHPNKAMLSQQRKAFYAANHCMVE